MNKSIIYNNELTEVQILAITNENHKDVFESSDTGKTFIIDKNGVPKEEGVELLFDLIDDTNIDFSYYGGSTHTKINRYSKVAPFTKTSSVGAWADRLTLTYN